MAHCTDEEFRFLDVEHWEKHLPPVKVADNDPISQELAESLEMLAHTVQALDIADTSFTSYSTAIDSLTAECFSLKRRLCRLKQVQYELEYNIRTLHHENNLLKHWNEVLDPGSTTSLYAESSSILERRKEATVRSAKEQHKQLEALNPLDIKVSISDYLSQKEKNSVMEKEIKEKREKIKAFKGLPTNFELARHELRQARQKQMKLIQLREELLGKMADSVS